MKTVTVREILRKITQRDDDGTHGHTCKCGRVWRHGEDQAGNTEAHTCRECGREVWQRDWD